MQVLRSIPAVIISVSSHSAAPHREFTIHGEQSSQFMTSNHSIARLEDLIEDMHGLFDAELGSRRVQ